MMMMMMVSSTAIVATNRDQFEKSRRN